LSEYVSVAPKPTRPGFGAQAEGSRPGPPVAANLLARLAALKAAATVKDKRNVAPPPSVSSTAMPPRIFSITSSATARPSLAPGVADAVALCISRPAS
jgi:hypothetical protein